MLQKSSEIRTGYKHKLGWFARTFFSKEKQVDKIYNTIQRLVEVKLARLEKIQTEKGSRDQLPIPKDLMKSVTSYLDIKSLASLQSVSSQTLRDIDSNMPEQAKEYGYTGPSINAKTWVKILNQVKELAQRQVIPDKYIIQKNGKINEKETMKELQKLTTRDLYAILSQEILYEPLYSSRFEEFLSTFHVQRGWRPQTSKMDDDLIRRGELALTLAVKYGPNKVIELLLEHGVNPNIRGAGGFFPIHLAACGGYKRTVELLLKNHAAVDSLTDLGETPLAWACWNGHKEIVQLLLESGANPNIYDNKKNFPIHLAACGGYKRTVELLLKNHAAVDSLTDLGETPLAWACWNGHKEIVQLLLESGANPNIYDNKKIFPIHVAAQKGHKEIVQMLLRKGARVDVTNGTGQTPVDLALQLSDTTLREQMISLLLDPQKELLKLEDPFLKPEAGQK